MSPPSPQNRQAIGIAIPSYRDGRMALDLCRSLLEMSELAVPLRVAIVSNGPREACFDSIVPLREEFEARGWRLEYQHNDQRGKCPAWERAEALLGDDCAAVVYLDADIRLDEYAITSIAREVKDGSQPRLLSPRPLVGKTANPLINGYGRVWSELPHVRKDVVGAGCFIVTQEGRRRWDRWPTVFADDTFVRLMFRRTERHVIEDSCFRISLPEKLADLVRIRARWMLGYRQLLRQIPDLDQGEDRRWMEAFGHFIPRVNLYPACVAFLGIWCAARVYLFFTADSATRDWARASSTGLRQSSNS